MITYQLESCLQVYLFSVVHTNTGSYQQSANYHYMLLSMLQSRSKPAQRPPSPCVPAATEVFRNISPVIALLHKHSSCHQVTIIKTCYEAANTITGIQSMCAFVCFTQLRTPMTLVYNSFLTKRCLDLLVLFIRYWCLVTEQVLIR